MMPCKFWLDILRPTSADNLPILASIQPVELHRIVATLFLARHAMEPGNLLHSTLTWLSSANARHFKSRHPFVPAAQQVISSSDNNNIRAAHWVDHQWNAGWAVIPTRLRIFIPDTGIYPPRMTPTRRAWVWLNYFHTGINGVRPPLRPVSVVQKNKPSTVLSSNVQSIDLPMDDGLHGLTVLDDKTIEWLLNICPEI